MLPKKKLLPDLVYGLDSTSSKLRTKCQNRLVKYRFFNFWHVWKNERKIKISKIQLHNPTNDSSRIFYAFAFSLHSTHLNVEFKITIKIEVLLSFCIPRRGTTKNYFFGLTKLQP